MAHLMARTNGNRNLVSDVLGFDPFRTVFGILSGNFQHVPPDELTDPDCHDGNGSPGGLNQRIA